MTDIAGLRKRVEAATGPSRELDGALWLALQPDEAMPQCWSVRGMRYAGHVHTKAEKKDRIKLSSEYLSPAFTASIDASLALVEKMRGDRPHSWTYEILAGAMTDAWARMIAAKMAMPDPGGWVEHLPRCIVARLLAALEAP